MSFVAKVAGLVVVVVTIAGGALFALQNTTLVPLDLLIIQLPERTLALWLLLALALGVLIGLMASSFVFVSLRARLIAARRQKDRLAVEVDRLRRVGLAQSE